MDSSIERMLEKWNNFLATFFLPKKKQVLFDSGDGRKSLSKNF